MEERIEREKIKAALEEEKNNQEPNITPKEGKITKRIKLFKSIYVGIKSDTNQVCGCL